MNQRGEDVEQRNVDSNQVGVRKFGGTFVSVQTQTEIRGIHLTPRSAAGGCLDEGVVQT